MYVFFFYNLLFAVFSDLVIKLDGKELRGHKFVLAARSDHWGIADLNQCTELELTGKV